VYILLTEEIINLDRYIIRVIEIEEYTIKYSTHVLVLVRIELTIQAR